ncbi:MAG: hypothetical protein OEW11_08975 [Nitrospirota bacterium]|nr:hypothetical protein [Nitrospirota bacterium]
MSMNAHILGAVAKRRSMTVSAWWLITATGHGPARLRAFVVIP